MKHNLPGHFVVQHVTVYVIMLGCSVWFYTYVLLLLLYLTFYCIVLLLCVMFPLSARQIALWDNKDELQLEPGCVLPQNGDYGLYFNVLKS